MTPLAFGFHLFALFYYTKAYPGRYFAVAASSLGDVTKPRWCYTNELFDGLFASKNNAGPNSNPAAFVILTNFVGEIIAYTDGMGQFACEAY